jgi:four helix bundle protein
MPAREIRPIRCVASAVAANYRAACLSKSRADFISKLATVVEEADESVYWLELLRDTNVSAPPAPTLLDEARQLVRIFAASLRTAKRRKQASQTSQWPN